MSSMEVTDPVTLIISYVALFVSGFVLGYVVGLFRGSRTKAIMPMNWQGSSISVIVPLMWAFSIVFDIILLEYTTPIAIHGIMGLVTGYYFPGNISDLFKRK